MTFDRLKVCEFSPDMAFEIHVDGTPKTKLVAAVFHRKDDPSRCTRDEARRLARLLAAAPGLVKACEAFHFVPDCGGDWCDLVIANTPDECPHGRLCRWAYENEQRFKAALAGVEGRQP